MTQGEPACAAGAKLVAKLTTEIAEGEKQAAAALRRGCSAQKSFPLRLFAQQAAG
jgi:hypothetical protein